MAVAHGGLGVHLVAAQVPGDRAALLVEGEVGAVSAVGGGDVPAGAVQRAVLGLGEAHGVAGRGGQREAAAGDVGLQLPGGQGAGDGLLAHHHLLVAGPQGGLRVGEADAVAVGAEAGLEEVAAVAAGGPAVLAEGEVGAARGTVGGAVDGDAVDGPADAGDRPLRLGGSAAGARLLAAAGRGERGRRARRRPSGSCARCASVGPCRFDGGPERAVPPGSPNCGCRSSAEQGQVRPEVGALTARADLGGGHGVRPGSRPLTSRIQVSGSVSTTFGGVPRVCRGPSTHCTTANGGTRTSVEPPGAFAASASASSRTQMASACRSYGTSRPGTAAFRSSVWTTSSTARVTT